MRRYKDEWHTMNLGYETVRVSVLVPTLYGRWCTWREERTAIRAQINMYSKLAEVAQLQAEYQLEYVRNKYKA